MKWKIFAGLVAALMVAGAIPFTNVGAQIATQQTSDFSTPTVKFYDDVVNSGNYTKVGHVEVIYGNFGYGHITVTAYQASITLIDDNNDGMVETTVGVDYAIWQPWNKTKHVLILFGIWDGDDCITYGITIATTSSEGWNYGKVLTTFKCPTSRLSPDGTTFTTHVRAISTFDYGHDTAPFTVYLGTDEVHQNPIGFPSSVDIKIDYPTGTVVANDVTSVTAGNNVGEYYLHTSSGETYQIDDTILAYLIE